MPLMIKLNRNVVRVYLCLDNGHFITVFTTTLSVTALFRISQPKKVIHYCMVNNLFIFQTHLKRTCPFPKKILSADKQSKHLFDLFHLFFFCFLDFLLQFLVFPDIMPHCDKVDLHLNIVMSSSVESVITHILLKVTKCSFCFIISLEHEFLAFFTCDIFSYFLMKLIKFLAVVYASSNSGFSAS